MLPNRAKVDISVRGSFHPQAPPVRPTCSPMLTLSLGDVVQAFTDAERELFEKYGKVPTHKSLLGSKLKVSFPPACRPRAILT
jgi:hypothetical protein